MNAFIPLNLNGNLFARLERRKTAVGAARAAERIAQAALQRMSTPQLDGEFDTHIAARGLCCLGRGRRLLDSGLLFRSAACAVLASLTRTRRCTDELAEKL